MKQKIVVSNIRIPQSLWLQVKTAAASHSMSINEYITYLIDDSTRRTFFGYKEPITLKKTKKTRLYKPFLDLFEKSYGKKPMGASEEDKIIYDIDDK